MPGAPFVVDTFDPGWTPTTPLPAAPADGVAVINGTRSIGWWHYGRGALLSERVLQIIDHSDPAAPVFGTPITFTQDSSASMSGATRPVPGTVVLLTEGPQFRTVKGHTYDATTLVISTGTDFTFPNTHASGTVQFWLTVVPLSSTRAFAFLQTNSGAIKNVLWHLVSIGASGVSAIIATGHFVVTTTNALVMHTAFRIDNTRALMVLTDGSAAVITDTGAGATVGTPSTGIHVWATRRRMGPGNDGYFYTSNSAGIQRVTITGSTISRTTLPSSTPSIQWAPYPFTPAWLISLEEVSGIAQVIDKTSGAAGPTSTLNEVPAAFPAAANIAPEMVYTASWQGPTSAWTPRIHLISADVPALGGWGVGMVRMGAN